MTSHCVGRRIAVIGAGAVGLSTAVCLQETLGPSADITVIADRFNTETVSTIAAGLFRISSEHMPGTPIPLLKRWSKDSFEFFERLAYSEEAGISGIAPMPLTNLYYEKPPVEPLFKDYVYGFRTLTQKELQKYPGHNYGVHCLTTIMEGGKLLPWLMKKFKSGGGKVEVCKLSSLETLVGKYDVVVTCCGLGARELLGDKTVYPVRGQVIRVAAPWIKVTHFSPSGAYIINGKDYTTVGGVRQVNNFNTNNDPKDTDAIWKRAVELIPSLKHAEWLGVYTGLRPTRQPLRVEKEIIRFGDKKLQVVHNYGHGAHGIGLSWGTAKHATQLVMEYLQHLSKL